MCRESSEKRWRKRRLQGDTAYVKVLRWAKYGMLRVRGQEGRATVIRQEHEQMGRWVVRR